MLVIDVEFPPKKANGEQYTGKWCSFLHPTKREYHDGKLLQQHPFPPTGVPGRVYNVTTVPSPSWPMLLRPHIHRLPPVGRAAIYPNVQSVSCYVRDSTGSIANNNNRIIDFLHVAMWFCQQTMCVGKMEYGKSELGQSTKVGSKQTHVPGVSELRHKRDQITDVHHFPIQFHISYSFKCHQLFEKCVYEWSDLGNVLHIVLFF